MSVGTSEIEFSEMGRCYREECYCLLAAMPKIQSSRTPALINTTSMSGITRMTQHHFTYNVANDTAIHLTSLLAQNFIEMQSMSV